jgi:hypothetical protein
VETLRRGCDNHIRSLAEASLAEVGGGEKTTHKAGGGGTPTPPQSAVVGSGYVSRMRTEIILTSSVGVPAPGVPTASSWRTTSMPAVTFPNSE